MPLDLRAYDHLLLDMNGTFLFGFDRFGPGEDFGATYARAGYAALAPADAHRRVRAAYDYLAARYVDEAYYHRFPSVAEALRATGAHPVTAAAEAELVDTFALHELGYLPDAHAAALRALAGLRPISVLSNLWAPKPRWLARLGDYGVRGLFAHLLFSSDGAEMKPHPRLFARAVGAIGSAPQRILYVGDSYRCDVVGATGAGLDAVYLAGAERPATRVPARPGLVAVYPDLPAFVADVS